MLAAGAISPREAEQVASAARVAGQRVAAAEEAVSLVREGPRAQQLAVAEAEVDRARAALAGRTAANDEYVLVAPIDGVILSRLVEPGDLLAVGRPAVVLGEVRQPWVRVYVPARVLPSLQIGDSASINPPGAGTVSSGGEADGGGIGPWPGRIIAINPQAEYVTRVALTEEERADLLFGIKVAIDDTTGAPKPGLPVAVTLPTARVPR
jgi:HlyD family secretion protein